MRRLSGCTDCQAAPTLQVTDVGPRFGIDMLQVAGRYDQPIGLFGPIILYSVA